MNNYAQFDEDIFVLSYFNDNRKYYGVEIGASDGLHGSPTKLLEENGWDILCIEANPLSYNSCKKNRKYAINFAIGKDCVDNVDFTVFNLKRTENRQEAISSLVPDERLIKQHEEMGVLLNKYLEKVNMRTLDFCLENWSKELNKKIEIDFISIDTEGTELDVIDGFNLSLWKPKLIALENNYEDIQYRNKMLNLEYKLINRIGVNDFYAKN